MIKITKEINEELYMKCLYQIKKLKDEERKSYGYSVHYFLHFRVTFYQYLIHVELLNDYLLKMNEDSEEAYLNMKDFLYLSNELFLKYDSYKEQIEGTSLMYKFMREAMLMTQNHNFNYNDKISPKKIRIPN